jgi:hypothetical protein
MLSHAIALATAFIFLSSVIFNINSSLFLFPVADVNPPIILIFSLSRTITRNQAVATAPFPGAI